MEYDDLGFENLQVVEDIPTHVIDEALVETRELELDYMEKKKASSEANAKFVDAKEKLIGLLKRVGKDRWDSPDDRFLVVYSRGSWLHD